MYAELLGAVRSEAFTREFYRNCPRTADLSDVLLGSQCLAPSRLPAWPELMLVKFGDLLINTGTRLKKLAQPRAVLSQEIL